MKHSSRFFLGACLALALGSPLLRADTTREPDVRTARTDRINIRGQPSTAGEVLGQLNTGDRVTVLEVVRVDKPKAGDATNWLKIALPPTVPVWVHSQFVDTNKMTVSANRLNVRGGPGENFSVVGRVERGEKLKLIRRKDEWLQIAPPMGSFGYVVAEFFTAPAPPPVAVTPPPPVETAPPPVVTPPVAPPATSPPPSVVVVAPPVITNPPTVVTPPAPLPDIIKEEADAKERNLAKIRGYRTPPTGPGTNLVVEVEAAPRRIVTREGMVRYTVHINAPSWYVLEALDTRKVINYLHPASTNIVLGQFRDKRVMVTGEEGLDRRWPNTPVLRIQKPEDIQPVE
ncbi:SH3 domain-containing protein [Fontisphaera persica]|uniref:SH3 domain-containing protein n=1 Tax=Fontisphaera persica TaxID=2974023 RepID=UPI0024BFA584|nr:SH3 domain-containing protein [Fontisphaera persica]WCJ59031.1 SH3 domain-containing protein [Fontisphaera persica]